MKFHIIKTEVQKLINICQKLKKSSKALKINSFYKDLCQIYPSVFSHGHQHDASEIMMFILNWLPTDTFAVNVRQDFPDQIHFQEVVLDLVIHPDKMNCLRELIDEYGRGTPEIKSKFVFLNLQRHAPHAKIMDDPITFKLIESFGNFNYELQSLILHHGESWDRGHFVTVSRKNGKWLLFDDDRVATLDDDFVNDAITVHGHFNIDPLKNPNTYEDLIEANLISPFASKYNISLLLFRQVADKIENVGAIIDLKYNDEEGKKR